MRQFLMAVLLALVLGAFTSFAATTTPIENLSIGGGPADSNGGASIDYTGTGLWNGNQTLYDNKTFALGTDGDFKWKFNTSNSRLELNDSAGNTLLHVTDDGTTGTLHANLSIDTRIQALTNSLLARQYHAYVTVSTTVTAAVAAITDATPNKRYCVYVPNGTYNNEAVICKDYVDIVGQSRDGVILNSSSETDDTIYVGGAHCMIANMTITHTLNGATHKYPLHGDGDGAKSDAVCIFYNLKCETFGTYTSPGPSPFGAIGVATKGPQKFYFIDVEATSATMPGILVRNAQTMTSPGGAYLINCTATSTKNYGLIYSCQGSGQSDSLVVVGGTYSGPTNDILSVDGATGAGEVYVYVDPTTTGDVTITDGTRIYTLPAIPLPHSYISGGIQSFGNLEVGANPAPNSFILLNAKTASYRGILWETASLARWRFATSVDAESGANAGANLILTKYADAGSSNGDVLNINRATGKTTFNYEMDFTHGTATLGKNTATVAELSINGAATTYRGIDIKTAGNYRWSMLTSTDAESGADAGANLNFTRYTDAGASNGISLTLNRATGNATFGYDVEIDGGDLTADDATFNLFNATVQTLNFGGALTTLNSGAGAAATANLNYAAINSNQATVALFGTPTSITLGGAATTLNSGAGASATANLNYTTAINLNSGAINSNQATVALLATPTTINVGAASAATNFGTSSGTPVVTVGKLRMEQASSTELRIGSTFSSAVTIAMRNAATGTGINPVFNFDFTGAAPDSETIQMFRNSTAIAGNVRLVIFSPNTSTEKFAVDAKTGDIVSAGDLAVNGGDLTSSSSTFNLLAANATTVNAFGAASVALNIGNASAPAAFLGGLSVADAKNIAVGTTTGTQIATATTQKLGWWGATPIVQPASADQAAVTLGNTNGEIAGLTFSASPTQAEVEALRDKCEELADDTRALSTLIHALRAAGVNTGLIKGAS